MRTITLFIFGLLLAVTSTLQLAAIESEQEQFKQRLLQEIRAEIKDLSPTKIKKIIDEVEADLNAYVEHYEDTPEQQLKTKGELYLEANKPDLSIGNFALGAKQSGKSVEQLMLEADNPRLKMLSEDEYRYNEETKEFDVLITKDDMFNRGEDSMLQVEAKAHRILEKGDVLINLDNGSSGGLFK